jgi:hypothetical protein
VATVDGLISRVRLEIGDLATSFTSTIQGNGGKEYYAKAKPLEAVGLTVTVDGASKANPTDFTVDVMRGVIKFNAVVATTSTIVVSGTHYRYFTTDDLTTFVNTAVTQHTYNRTDSYGRQMTVTLLPDVEEYPVMLLASIESLWSLATDSAFDINITAPDGVQIPRNQRFSQLSAIIGQRKAQYQDLCAQLNVGLWRLEMGTLRRVSRTTNKLIPVYVPQEIDDARKPERVYLQNDLTGRTPIPTTAQVYDIVLMQGDYWEAIFDFPDTMEALEDYTIKAQIRTYPESPTLIASFNVSIYDSGTKKLKLALTPDVTQNFPLKAYWDLQFTKSTAGVVWYELTPIKGLVFADRQVTSDGNAPVSTVHIAGSVRTVSTYNISLSGLLTIDGVTLANGDRVLVNGQTTTYQNGIYIVNSSGAWVRATDADTSAELIPGLQVFVDKGATTYGETGWVLNNSTPVNVGTDPISFVMTIQRGWSRN